MTGIARHLSAGAAVLLAALAAAAQAQDGTELGTVDCSVEGEQALVLGASEGLVCRFEAADGGVTDTYFGMIEEVAPAVEITPDTTIRWTVMSVGPDGYSPGQLEGEYQSLEETPEALGVLVGGEAGDLLLIPTEMPAEDGNIAAGIVAFQLRAVRA